MLLKTSTPLALVMAALISAPGPVSAQESEGQQAADQTEEQALSAADPTQVLATVNGTDITLGHVIATRAQLPAQYQSLPDSLLFDGILEQLIQQTLLVDTFKEEPSLQSRIRLENETRSILAAEAISGLVSSELDHDILLNAYNAQYPENDEELEYRASHILVETLEEAQALTEDLEGGAQFAALARENSIGPSSTVGGDIGWFGDGDMVPEFFAAVVELEPGGISEPVQTQFGWHVINLVETRETQRPAFDTVRPELEEQLRQSRLEDHLNGLAENATIDRADISGIDPGIISRFDLLEN